ncbi:ABC transporter permease [Roseivirga sp.]|uniref:ABC transporter permease n=1 Tax=Roseivirga sp. TaxID=1964215 RepID=UPI002B26C60E|nr:ABC transporter permease [Roseivirga sp.]
MSQMNNTTPPKILKRLISLMFPPSSMEEIEGDLNEDFYHNTQNQGHFKARLKYAFDVLMLFRLYFRMRSKNRKPTAMQNLFSFHFKFGLRAIYRQRLHQSINIATLTLGFSCFALIFLFVYNQQQKDNFLTEPERIVRLGNISENGEGSGTVVGIGQLLVDELPEVEAYSLVTSSPAEVKVVGQTEVFEEKIISGLPSLIDIFQLEIVNGTNLSPGLQSVLISQKLSEKLFSNGDAIGKELSIVIRGKESNYTIAGVLKDLPVNSSYSINVFKLIKIREDLYDLNSRVQISYPIYFKVTANANLGQLGEKIPEALKAHTSNESMLSTQYVFRTLDEIKSNINTSDSFVEAVDGQVVYIFSIVGVVILLLAIANYINLSAALSLKRMQEVCVRKVMGASKRTIILQQIVESFIVCFIALALTSIIVWYFVPKIENYLSTSLQIPSGVIWWIILVTLLGLTALTLFSSLYPAILVTRIKFSEFLKGRVAQSPKGKFVRNILLVVQFSISASLIVGTLTFMKQLRFIDRVHNTEVLSEVLIINGKIGKSSDLIRSELNSIPEIEKLSISSMVPGPKDNSRGGIGTNEFAESFDFYTVDENFVEVLGLKIVQGEDFYQEGLDNETHVLMNESMAAMSQENPIGKEFNMGRPKKSKVLGIVRDFPIESVKEKIKPSVYLPRRSDGSTDIMLNKIAIRYKATDLKRTIAQIEAAWRTIYPDQVFDLEFMDDRIKRTYSDELKMGNIFSVFTIIAVLISCLGLFGLITYIVHVRMKEVSIRKILGANFLSLAQLLTKKIWYVLIVASVISFPLAYYLLQFWLESFAYRTEITAEVFMTTLILFMTIVSLTIFLQVKRVTMLNPAEVLRNE